MMMTLGFHKGYVGADTVLSIGDEIEELVYVIEWGRSAPRHCM